MHIAITGADSLLGRALVGALGAEHEVSVIDGDLREPAVARAGLAGVEAIVHLAPLATRAGDGSWQDDCERLDQAARGTYVLLNAAIEHGVRRIVLGSTLELLADYPAHWDLDENWQPRPDVTDVRQLAIYLAEESAKQIARVEPLEVLCLRLATIVNNAATAGQPYDPRWVHVDDAVQAVVKALSANPGYQAEHSTGRLGFGWWLFHIPGGGRYTLVPLTDAAGPRGIGYAPVRDFMGSEGADAAPPEPPADIADRSSLTPRQRIPSRPIRSVLMLGAGGPLAAGTSLLLAPSYRLRLTDAQAIAEIEAANKPQSPGAPLQCVLGPPHETRVVDVTNYDQVLGACEGMDAIVNCTVLRPHPVEAFRVNMLGAYLTMRAAVASGIRRVVHTGPLQVISDRQSGYTWDFDISPDTPARPGNWLYLHTKYLGQELVRLFAEAYDLEVPSLFFYGFINPALPRGHVGPMTVSWDDAGHAIRRAIEVPALTSPFEIFHINADLPHGRFPGTKAYQLLGWFPRDDLAHLWARRQSRRGE